MGGTVTIRLCSRGDEESLSLVARAAFLEAFAGVIPGHDIIAHCRREHAPEKYAGWLGDPRTVIWIAETAPGRAPVGYLVLTTPDLPLRDVTGDDLEVKRLYLLHRFQRHGLGTRLMNEGRRSAEIRGSRRLLLGVYSHNTTAIRFYERLGYRRLGTRQFRVGKNTCRDLILGLELASETGR